MFFIVNALSTVNADDSTQNMPANNIPQIGEKRVIVQYKDGHNKTRRNRRRSRVRRQYKNIQAESMVVPIEEINEMINDPDIEIIEEDVKIKIFGQDQIVEVVVNCVKAHVG